MRMCTHMWKCAYTCVCAWMHSYHFPEQFPPSALSSSLFTSGFSLYIQVQVKGLIVRIQVYKLCCRKSLGLSLSIFLGCIPKNGVTGSKNAYFKYLANSYVLSRKADWFRLHDLEISEKVLGGSVVHVQKCLHWTCFQMTTIVSRLKYT